MTITNHEHIYSQSSIAVLYQHQPTPVKEANFILFLPDEKLNPDELVAFKQELNADLLIAVISDKATVDYPCLQVADKTIYCDYQYIPQLMALFNNTADAFIALDANDFTTGFARADKAKLYHFRTSQNTLEQDCQRLENNTNILLNLDSDITGVIYSVVSSEDFDFYKIEKILNIYNKIYSDYYPNISQGHIFREDYEFCDIYILVFSSKYQPSHLISRKYPIEIQKILNMMPANELPLNLTIGKNDRDERVVINLCRAPHLLIAGNTTSSQSDFLKSLVMDIAKLNPKRVRTILIDLPKVNFSIFEELPHLLMPIITDVMRVNKSLLWCIEEMERRYQIMSAFGISKIDDLNKKIHDAESGKMLLMNPLYHANGESPQSELPTLDTFPKIVILINELAELMLYGNPLIEEQLVYLCQKSRAYGIHLILATQNLSTEVITDLIKANVPARMAFRVNSPIESHLILDEAGAENLMTPQARLFLGGHIVEPFLLHGDFASNGETHKVCEHWLAYQKAINLDLTKQIDLDVYIKSKEEIGAEDILYQDAVNFVLESRKASASSIQRKFSIFYTRASKLLDMMEERGILSPLGMNEKREILITKKV